MKVPSVSIMIPVYNRKIYIGECIQSALDQTVQNFEIVIVDNASDDGTWEICQHFALKDERIRIFRNDENIGPVRNWKRCFDEARGVYGKLLFSDDLIYPEYLEKTITYLKDPGIGFVFTDIKVGPTDDGKDLLVTSLLKNGKVRSEEYIKLSYINGAVPKSPGAALFRLSDMRNNLIWNIPSPSMNDFLSYGAGPDVLLYLLIANKYPNVARVGEALCYFRGHKNSITVTIFGEKVASYYRQALIWFADQYEYHELRNQYLVWEWLRMCWRNRSIMSFQQFAGAYLFVEKSISLMEIVSFLYERVRTYHSRIDS